MMQRNGTNEARVQEYAQGWYDMMTRIWRDRLQMMGVYDTGHLLKSVGSAGLSVNGYEMTAAFQFIQYGIYVDAGTGNGYTRGNGGYLQLLDKGYRHEHGMKKQRKRRPWFSRSWAISCRVLADEMQRQMGDAFVGLFDDLAD